MKTKSMLLTAVAAFAGMAAFVACDKDEDTPTPTPVDTSVTIKVAASQTNDTLQVPYNGTLDLSAIFSLEQAQGGTATLTYTIDRQPDFAEGTDEEYTSVEAYRATGNTLVSIQGVRVPDNVNVPDDNRLRVVREGKLKVSTVGSDITFTIVQTGKPALVPTIALDPEIDGLDNGTLTLTTTGQPRSFNATYFTISPIDFGISDIRVDIGEGAYITTSLSGVPQAGGSSGTAGTGGYIVAFHRDNTLAQVKNDATLPQARLYINVDYVAPTAAVGFELNPNIGAAATSQFYSNTTNQRKAPSYFIVVKLNNGTTRAYDSNTDGALLVGNFSAHLEGRQTEDTPDHPGWWSYVALKAADAIPECGTAISFDVTSKVHFGEPDWTVTVATRTMKAANTACD